MVIANGTCFSFCNKPKAHFGLFSVYAPRLMLHGWKEDSMLVKRIAAGPSIFNRLRAIVRYWSEIATFPYTFAI